MENNQNNTDEFMTNEEIAMRQVQKPLSHAGGFAFSAAAVLFVVVASVFTIITIVAGIEENTDAYTYINYLAAPVAITAAVFITMKYKKIGFKSMFPLKCKPKYFLIAVLLIFGLLFFVGLIDAPVLEFFKLLGYKERGADSYFPNVSGGWIVLALLVMAVMPAVFEEALFRGVILNTCENSLGTIRTVCVVGFCFSLFHSSPEQTVYQFIAGCAFAYIAIHSGSILPSVFMHFLNNALIVILRACNLFDEAGSLIMSQTAFIIVTVCAALSFVGAIVWLVLDKKPLKKCQKGAVKAFFLYASVGIGILGLMWIMSFFFSG
ncbi:MAG: CPBP family intramembrane metalloprotease [Clostridia bacterium]|nr:CPBP family intramembrane metalloprotease [Clostridia bacterium]